MAEKLTFRTAFARWDDSRLVIGNQFLQRTIDLQNHYPVTVSLVSGGTEFSAPQKNSCDCSFFGLNMPGRNETDWHISSPVSAVIVENPPFDAPHIEVRFSFKESYQQAEFTRIFRIYPDLPAISVQNELVSQSIPNCYWSYRPELSAACSRFPDAVLESDVDSIALADGVKAVKSVEFRGRTDYHNDLVIEHSAAGNGEEKFSGNLLILAENDVPALLVLQEAPPSAERRDFEKYDFRIGENTLCSCCWGVMPGELMPGKTFRSYRTVWIALTGKGDLTAALHNYLSGRFPMAESEAAVLVNPWGCGRFPQLTGEKFLLDEIAAAGLIGAEVYQIDDSWQQGKGLNELTGNNLAISADFWQINSGRLPAGFAPLVDAAENAGVKLGLWCAPSYTRLFADHAEFAAMLLDYHRKYHFATVKIDGVRIQNYQAQENLESLLRTVREKSGKQIFFNLDTTNGQRPGYFYFLEYGNIFLENRYCYLPGEISYHPEKTLRNLWQLSRYVRPQTLQIEVPSPADIRDPAPDAPDPAAYSFDYWCAIAIFANMLIWTAPSALPPEYADTLREMIGLHRKIRRDIFHSVISPVGTEPDGKSFTGLSSDAGYVLIFKEKDCPQESFELPFADGKIIAGKGAVKGRQLTMPAGSWCVVKA
ncbi:MAG: hypothetical protein E7053_06370 [Lentisphaerae bacterium]|nr:hypothetical protein [Lentisphaerota bacterium]